MYYVEQPQLWRYVFISAGWMMCKKWFLFALVISALVGAYMAAVMPLLALVILLLTVVLGMATYAHFDRIYEQDNAKYYIVRRNNKTVAAGLVAVKLLPTPFSSCQVGSYCREKTVRTNFIVEGLTYQMETRIMFPQGFSDQSVPDFFQQPKKDRLGTLKRTITEVIDDNIKNGIQFADIRFSGAVRDELKKLIPGAKIFIARG